MKHFLIAIGFIALAKETKNFQSAPKYLTPYIQTNIKVEKPKPNIIQKQKPNTLVDALILVESSGNPKAFNEKENACGCLQIRPIMLREVNRILRKQGSSKRFSKEDRWDCWKSKEMFYIWRNYHHADSSDEIIARNWNGGPRGYKKPSTEHYWHKVQLQWAN